jgi:hypothetical protein
LKNLFYTTNMTNVSGLGNKEGSDRAFDLYMKVRYLQKLNGGKGVVFATATPVMNSMSEMYIMQKYLQSDLLEQRNLMSFDAWANQFGEVVTVMEMTPEGKGYRQKKSFSKFKNLGDLVQMFRSFADVLTDIPGLKIPAIEGGKRITVVSQPTDFQTDYINELAKRAEAVRSGSIDPREDNMLKITSEGRKLAYDQRLIDPEAADVTGSKVNMLVDNVFKVWKETKAKKSAQLIFGDLSTPKGENKSAVATNADADAVADESTENVSIYDDIKRKLVARGIPSNEIAFIHDAKSDTQKLELFEKVNTGAVRVLIGSTEKMGVGMNAQKKLIALHHMDAPWRPGDIEQREGRILRQGNENEEVQIYTYVTEKTFDARMWDNLLRKATFIHDIMTSGTDVREAEDIGEFALSAAEISAIASGNPLIQEQFEVEADVKKLTALKLEHEKTVSRAKSNILSVKGQIEVIKDRIQKIKADIAARQDVSGDAFHIVIEKKTYTEREAAGRAIIERYQKFMPADRDKIGTFAGFDLFLSRQGELVISGEFEYKGVMNAESPSGTIQSIEAVVRNMDKTLLSQEGYLENLKNDLPKHEKAAKATFEREAELQDKVKRQTEIRDILSAPTDEGAMTDEEADEDDGGEKYALNADTSGQSISSADTSINSSKLPAVFSKIKFEPGTVNLDIGGGRFDNATEFLATQGVTNYIFDPYNRTPEHNTAVAAKTENGQSDTVTISNVLNVIKEPEARELVLLNAIDALKPGGTVYITIYEGDGSGVGKETSKGYQLNKKTVEYKDEIKKLFNDVVVKNGVIIAQTPKKSTGGKTNYLMGLINGWGPSPKPPVNKVMSLTNLMEKIRHDFGIPVTSGNIRKRNAAGAYYEKPGTIRTRISNDLPTVAHELGHHFDYLYGLSSAPDDILTEITSNLPSEFKDRYKDEALPGEGVAEFVRRYLSDRAQAEVDYPAFYPYFTQKLSNDELTLLDGLADEVHRYLTADLDETSSAAISMPGDSRDFRTFGEKAADRGDAIYQAMVNSNHGIRRFSNFVDNQRPYILATNSAYADSVASSIIEHNLTDIKGDVIGLGLKQALKGVNVRNKTEFRDFNEYLVVRHGPERLKEGMRVYADDRKNKADFMTGRQQRLEYQYPHFKAAAERVYEFERQLLKAWAVDTGLISQDTADKWGERWKYYVPFNRVVEQQGGGVRRGYANQSAPFRKARGSGLDIIAPIESIAKNATKLIQAAIRNQVMQEITKAAAATDGAGLFLEKVPAPITATKYNAVELKKKLKTELMEGLPDEAIDAAFTIVNEVVDDILIQYGRGKAHGDIVTVMKVGKPEFWQINDALLLESVTNMAPARLPAFIEAYGRITRVMTSNITGNNLIWSIFSNMPRDIVTFMTYSENKNPVKIIGNIAKSYVERIKAFRGSSHVDPYYLEFLAMGGGGHSSYLTADRDEAARALNKLIGAARLRWMNPFEWIEAISDAIEGGPRFAYYRMMRQAGKSREEAFYDAMDITTNFRRSGTESRNLNKIAPFFNASVQGIDRFARWLTATDVPSDKRAKAVAGRWTYYILSGLALAFAQVLFAELRDDEGYTQLSAYVKNNFWNIPLGDHKFFSIPKPRELAALSSAFERLLEMFIMDNPKAFDGFDEYLTGQLLPPIASGIANAAISMTKGESIETGIGQAVGDIGILGTGASMLANSDFRGVPIVSKAYEHLEPRAQFNNRTSKVAVIVGNALNWSPLMIDYFLSATLGGYWKVVKAVAPMAEGERDYSMGVEASYIKDSRYSTDVVNNFYNQRDKFDKLKATYPDNPEYKIRANDYDDMATFYSRYNQLSKSSADTLQNLQTRQMVIDMLEQFMDEQEHGRTTQVKKDLDKLAASVMETTFYPQVMAQELIIGAGNKKKTYPLTASQYVEYQTVYLGFYWEEVGKRLKKTYRSVDEKVKAVEAGKRTALERVKEYMAKKLGVK